MRVKVYVIELDVPARAKKWGLRLGVPALGLLMGGVAFAGLPASYSDGQTLSAKALNDNFNYVEGQITTLQGQVHPASAFRAELTTTFNVASNVETPIVFDSTVFDLAHEYNAQTGTFTPNNPGTYLIACDLSFATPSSAALFSTTIAIGANNLGGSAIPTASASAIALTAQEIVSLAAGDSVTCHGYQKTGSTEAVDLAAPHGNFFAAARLY